MPTHRVVSMDELTQYLHLPEKAVAKQLGICLTSLKKLCRQHGITRWPYRKLKSLDKKIAKAENGSGTGTEDVAQLKLRAEELKKEKMAVAFTYGLKEKAGGGGLEFDAAAVAAANGESPAKSASKPKKPKAAVKKDDSASNGSSASFTSGIPTPPDEGGSGSPMVGHDEDIFDSDEMGHPHMMDENGMNPTDEWVAPDVDGMDDVHVGGDEAEDQVKVELLGKDKHGSVKMTLTLPGTTDLSCDVTASTAVIDSSKIQKSSLNVSASDLQIASALASSVNTPNTPDITDELVKSAVSHSKGAGEPADAAAAHPPRFDVVAPDSGLSADLMHSDFFSSIPHPHEQHDEHEHEDGHVVCMVEREDASPGGSDSSRTTVEVDDTHISTEITDASWGDDPTHAWFTPDTPDKKKGDEKEILSLQTADLGVTVTTRTTRSSPSKVKAR